MLSVEQLSKQIADICPEDHLKSFLQRDVRPDGRSLDELRPLVLAKNVAPTADSSAMIRLGNTKVICGITAETIKPAAATPTDGSFSVNFEFSPVCSPNAKAGPPNEVAQTMSIFLDGILKQVFDNNQLCIEPDVLAWTLFIDVYCLEDDGNVTDAAMMSVISSLRDLKLPEITIDEETAKPVVNVEKSTPVSLKMIPVSTTYGEFSGILLLDPTARETELGSSPITVVCSEKGALLCFNRSGGSPLSQEQVAAAIENSKRRSSTIYDQYFA
ncbi:Oidioi.mRNA.OKI2018_I69.chr1.g3062.t2.cds [Oikopleura dioica]|uniref:Ribosomal RNA-processing protein 43 n=1 Tax=Oikopleura dioica TaxID=34765 RepID=A0ABN7SYF4_OIKDI|nr:Oidioi.mRNA.OKI2018_I69.chr1.g3062.t2.cds [Oikopleura dioica]